MIFTSKGNNLESCVALICQAEVLPLSLLRVIVYITHAEPVVNRGERGFVWWWLLVWVPAELYPGAGNVFVKIEKRNVCSVIATVAETLSAYRSCLPNPLPPGTWGDLQVALSTKEFPSFQLSCWLWSQAIRISCDFLSPYFKWSFLRKLFGIQSIFPPLRNVINGSELLSPNTLVLLIMECTNGRNNELPFITTFCFLILKKIICEFQFGLLALCCWP